MAHGAAWGVSSGLDGRETASEAVLKALDELGTGRPAAALVLASQEFDLNEIMNSLAGRLGTVPAWGFSTSSLIVSGKEQNRSVAVAIFSGMDLKAQVHWFPAFAQDSTAIAHLLHQLIRSENHLQGVLLVTDGINGDAGVVCSSLANIGIPVAGGLAGGDVHIGKTYQLANQQVGSGALSALTLGGRFRLGIGIGHGWRDVGLEFTVTRVDGFELQLLGDRLPVEIYEDIFGLPLQNWSVQPLSHLVRLYPLGIEEFPGSADVHVRAPLYVDPDGTFRMNATVEEGSMARILVGDPERCVQSAFQAGEQALLTLGKNRPVLGLVLVDTAWQYLFEGHTEKYMDAIQKAVGDIPLVGAYTFGQIARPLPGMPPQVYNQHIEVILFGESDNA